MSLLENCRKFISFDTTPVHGNLELAHFIGQLAEKEGFTVEYQSETLNGLEQCNVIIRPDHQKDVQNEFMMQTHLDTVDPGTYSLWSQTEQNPFNASIHNDKIFGLGSADVKLDFLCKFEAVKKLKGKRFKNPWVLVATYGAQSGMIGAKKLMRKKLVNAKWALVGEPTNLQMMTSGLGYAVVEVSIPFSEEEKKYRQTHDLSENASTQSKMFIGKAAHSSNPLMGDNAITKMLDYLTQLPQGIAIMDLDGGINVNSVPSSAVLELDLVGELKDTVVPKIQRILDGLRSLEEQFQKFPHSFGDQTTYPSMNIGMIRTHQEYIRLSGSCRLPPNVTMSDYENWMESLSEVCKEVGATFRVTDYKPPFDTNNESNLVKACGKVLMDMGLNSEIGSMSTSTESSVFSRMGVECLVIGPGSSVGNSHAPNEHIELSELEKGIQFYQRVLESYCL